MADEIELKGTTPDDTVDTNAVLIGADTASSTAPVLFQIADIWSHLRSLSNTWSGTQTFSGNVEFEQLPTVNGTAVATADTAVTLASEQTLTNKTIALGSNTISGTTAQFNTALTDGSFAISGGAFHDGFSDFVANEHIDHSAVSVIAGNGLTGGGTIAASRTLNVGAGTGIAVAADTVSLSHLGLQSLTDPNADRIAFWDDSAGSFAWLTVSTGLTLSGTTLTVNASAVDHDSLSGFVANEHIDWTAASANLVTSGDITSTAGVISATDTATGTSGVLVARNNNTAATETFAVAINRQNSSVTAFALGCDSSNNALIAANGNYSLRMGKVVSGVWSEYLEIDSSGNLQLGAYGAGSLQTDASGNVTASSDERLKDNIAPYTRGLAEINNISPISYNWNARSGLDRLNMYSGFSAQNVQEAIPEAVGITADGFLTVSDRPIMAALVNAVQELSARVAQLEGQP